MSETEGDVARPPGAKDMPRRPGAKRASSRRWFSTFVTIGIIVLVAGAIALAISQFRIVAIGTTARDMPVTLADLQREIAQLKKEVQAAGTRVATLEKSDADAAAAGTDLAGMAARLGALDTRLGTVEGEAARAADRDSLSGLQDRVGRLEANSSGEALRGAASILALANLARAAENGTAFQPELAALTALTPDDPSLAVLAPLADRGVPSGAIIAARFPDAARAALDAERSEDAGGNILSRAWASLSRLVSIRRIRDAAGNTNGDRLARAQSDLDRGDLADAVMEVGGLTNAAATAMAAWQKDAEARLAIGHAVAEMNARVVQALAQPTQSPRP